MTAAEYRALPKAKRLKYRNVPTMYNGVRYDSKKEAEQAKRLDLLIEGGYVRSWQRQVRYRIVVNGMRVCTYVCDFLVTMADGEVEVMDVKGFKTPSYNLKKKLMKAVHGIEIVEV